MKVVIIIFVPINVLSCTKTPFIQLAGQPLTDDSFAWACALETYGWLCEQVWPLDHCIRLNLRSCEVCREN